MSRPAYIDVLLEVPASQLHNVADPTRELWEQMRAKAEQDCRVAGATLRTDSAPEVIVKQGHSSFVGDVTLLASRWQVDVPERVARTL